MLGSGKTCTDRADGRADGSANETWFKSYHAYQEHLQWLQALQAQHPNNSEIVTSGSSLEGNAITGIHFYGSGGKGRRPAVVFHGNVHAREWITSKVRSCPGPRVRGDLFLADGDRWSNTLPTRS